MSYSAPNYTQTPNELFAQLPHMGEAELKITLVIIRDTFGWKEPGAATVRSLSELMDLTGLSRQGVLNGLAAGMRRGAIYRTDGPKNKAAYGLMVNEVDRSTEWTGLPSRPQLVNTVDRNSQRSRPKLVNEVDRLTPVPGAPSAEKQAPERKERKERKERPTAAGVREDAAAATAQDQEREQAQQGSAEGADAPHGADGATATTVTDPVQAKANAGTKTATGTEKVPPAGATLAALTGALAGLKKTVPDLIEEYPDRAGWLEIAPERVRELLAQARAANGNRYRGALIDALDEEVRKANTPEKPAKTNVNDLVRARLQGVRS